MESIDIDLDNSCRGCLSSGDDLELIFECFYQNISIAQVLMNCIPTLIAECDGLSAKICRLCRAQAIKSHEFQQMFINSEKEIRSYLLANQNDDFNEEVGENPVKSDEISDECVSNIIDEPVLEIVSSNKTKKHPCKICNKLFPTPSKIERHMLVHQKSCAKTNPTPKKFHCEFCLKPFICQAKVLRHMTTHDPEKSAHFKIYEKTSQFKCTICDQSFGSRSSLTSHEFLHSEEIVNSQLPPESIGQFVCIICLHYFDTSDSLYDHIRGHYQNISKETFYECQLCAESNLDKKFNNLKAVIRHSKSHEENATHQCVFCELRMGYGEDFIEHMKKHKISTKCTECNKNFATRSNLTKHKLSVHAGVKKYICSICKTQFTQSSSLKAHNRIHSGEKPYSCEECNAKFNSSMDLKKHQSRKHASSSSQICEFPGCKFEFRFISSLRYHMQSHQKTDQDIKSHLEED